MKVIEALKDEVLLISIDNASTYGLTYNLKGWTCDRRVQKLELYLRNKHYTDVSFADDKKMYQFLHKTSNIFGGIKTVVIFCYCDVDAVYSHESGEWQKVDFE